MLQRALTLTAIVGSVVFLFGCVEDTGVSGTPTLGEQACLQATSIETNNGDVVLLSSRPVSGGTEVIVGVGDQRARWQCTAFTGGGNSRPMSLTNEGVL